MGAPSFKTWSNNTQQVHEPTNTFKTQTVFIIFCMKTKKSFHGMARGSHWRGIRSPNLPTATRGICFHHWVHQPPRPLRSGAIFAALRGPWRMSKWPPPLGAGRSTPGSLFLATLTPVHPVS